MAIARPVEVVAEGGGLTLFVAGAGPRREVWAYEGVERPLWAVRPRGRFARVLCHDEIDPYLREFLEACWDDFVDAGWPMDAWFLVDCPRCGALAFAACLDLTRPGKRIRTVHRERDPETEARGASVPPGHG